MCINIFSRGRRAKASVFLPFTAMTMDGGDSFVHEPDNFVQFLLLLLPVLQAPQNATKIPTYQGPRNWATDMILKDLKSMAARMHKAERALQERDSANSNERTERDTAPTPEPRRRTNSTPPTKPDTEAPVDPPPEKRERVVEQPNGKPMKLDISSMPAALSELNGVFNRGYTDAAGQSFTKGPVFSHSAPPTVQALPESINCPTCNSKVKIPDGIAMMNRFRTVDTTPAGRDGPPPMAPLGPNYAAHASLPRAQELSLLETQVMEVARVCKAVASGDLTQRIDIPVQGATMVQLKDIINTMVRSTPSV